MLNFTSIIASPLTIGNALMLFCKLLCMMNVWEAWCYTSSKWRNELKGYMTGTGSREVSRNQSGLLNWYNIPSHSNKTVKVWIINYFNKAVMTLFITSIYVYFCLSEEDQSVLRPLYSHPLHANLEYFLTYALISLLYVIFALAHETIYNYYDGLHILNNTIG